MPPVRWVWDTMNASYRHGECRLEVRRLNKKGLLLVATLIGVAATTTQGRAAGGCAPALDYTVRTLAGTETVHLCEAYQGKVILVVNTASKCAFTSQYEGLETLYRKYKDHGFAVLGFPSNDFGSQEPGTEQQIQSFCRLAYGVEFPMFEKTGVSKKNASPFFQRLATLAGAYPRWNFYKYLIDRNGNLVDYYSSLTKPDNVKLVRAIEALL